MSRRRRARGRPFAAAFCGVAVAAALGCGGRASTDPPAEDTTAHAPTPPPGPYASEASDDATGAKANGAGDHPAAADDVDPAAAAPDRVDVDEGRARTGDAPAAAAHEARRTRLTHVADEPMLRPHAATIRAHFSEPSREPTSAAPSDPVLDAQLVARFGSRRTTALLSDAVGRPLLVALDGSAASPDTSTIAWSKDRPLAGTFPGATQMALAAAPDDGVTLAWFDPTTHLVALRKWRADGVVEADFVLGPMEACDAVSALFWPGRGWAVVASDVGHARAFLLGQSGMLVWPREGVDVSLGRLATAPVTLAPLSEDALLVVGVGAARSGSRKAAEHVVALRLDASGATSWDTPADLGPAPPGAARIAASPDSRGVRVELGARGAVFVDAAGAVRRAR